MLLIGRSKTRRTIGSKNSSGALSYAGQFNVMAVADADAYPDIDVFATSARDDLRALVEATARLSG